MNEKEKFLCKQNSGIVLIDKLVVVYTGYLVYEIFEGPFWTEWLNEDHKVLINDKVKLHHREDVRMPQEIKQVLQSLPGLGVKLQQTLGGPGEGVQQVL